MRGTKNAVPSPVRRVRPPGSGLKGHGESLLESAVEGLYGDGHQTGCLWDSPNRGTQPALGGLTGWAPGEQTPQPVFVPDHSSRAGIPLAEPNGKPEARGTQVSPLGHKARWRRW